MSDILEMYNGMLKKYDAVTIRRKHVDRGVYYFEFTDVAYIKVEIDEAECTYKCQVLDPEKSYIKTLYTFTMSYDYVIEVGNFEDALTRMHNQVIRPIIMNAQTTDLDEAAIQTHKSRDRFSKDIDGRWYDGPSQ